VRDHKTSVDELSRLRKVLISASSSSPRQDTGGGGLHAFTSEVPVRLKGSMDDNRILSSESNTEQKCILDYFDQMIEPIDRWGGGVGGDMLGGMTGESDMNGGIVHLSEDRGSSKEICALRRELEKMQNELMGESKLYLY